MSLIELIVSEAIKRVLARNGPRQNADAWNPELLRPHIVEVVNWSRRVEFVGLAEARDTDRDTVALFMDVPRKFRREHAVSKPKGEDELITKEANVVLLGDPGAGKTTTLKRIARALLDEPRGSEDLAAYPIVIRLRELSKSLLLEEALGQAFGIRTERKAPLYKVARDDRSNEWPDEFQIITENRATLDVVTEVGNESRALFLLDGLDEVRPELRERTEASLMQMARKCEHARIRLTCRSGDYAHALEGFDTLELCPLEDLQIEEIIGRWCTSPEEFRLALSKLPFRDLPNRPLFLCQLIVLFERSGFLPQQPASVYKRIILLALEDWDRSKRVDRRSRYSGFDPTRKADFLASLAFHLTYVTEQKYFTPRSFDAVYESIRQAFDLPIGEALQVFTELESHTGIIVEAGFERYEFSHLSLQEFLAADYIVRDRISGKTLQQMSVNSAPLAISVAMSSNASQRLAAIILSPGTEHELEQMNVPSFLSRVLQESAVFTEDMLLGFAALAIIFAKLDRSAFVQSFLTLIAVQQSIGLALKAYTARELGEQIVILHLRSRWLPPPELHLPREGEITRTELLSILKVCGLELKLMETLSSADSSLGNQYFFVAQKIGS